MKLLMRAELTRGDTDSVDISKLSYVGRVWAHLDADTGSTVPYRDCVEDKSDATRAKSSERVEICDPIVDHLFQLRSPTRTSLSLCSLLLYCPIRFTLQDRKVGDAVTLLGR